MKKILSFLLMSAMVVTVWAGEVVFDFNANGLSMFTGITAVSTSSTHDGDITTTASTVVDGVTLSVSESGANTPNRLWLDYNLDAVQLRLYGGTLTLTAPEGQNITAAAFDASTFNQPGSSSGTFAGSTWVGSANAVAFSIGGQIRINKITVTIGEGGDVEPYEGLTVDSLFTISTLDDNTEFKFTNPVYVNYRNGKYLYVLQSNDEGYIYPALLYGNVDADYEQCDIIPGGWTGTKTTYRGLVEVTNPGNLQESVGQMDAEWAEPLDYTGYISYVGADLANYKVSFNGVKISDISDQNFTITEQTQGDDGSVETATLAGFNKFNIDLPTNESLNYYIEGMVAIFDDAVQFYPIAVKQLYTPLWKVWYTGEDGDVYTISDTLFVDYVDEAEKLVYITDNATTILYDEYAEWGYVWEEEWTPDWMAIDCNGNEELFNAVKAMTVIAPNTLTATLADNYTNPRLVIDTAPEALSGAVKPDIAYRSVALTDSLYAHGNEILLATGVYHVEDGTAYLYDIIDDANQTRQQVEVVAQPELTGTTLTEGATYTMKVVVKQHEVWESSNDYEAAPAAAPAKRIAAAMPAPVKAAARVKKSTRRKMMYDDPQWFTNYHFNAIEALRIGGIYGDVDGNSIVDLSDLNIVINAILGSGNAATDVNGSGSTDVSDMNEVINIILQ